jgi:hypothetical protein
MTLPGKYSLHLGAKIEVVMSLALCLPRACSHGQTISLLEHLTKCLTSTLQHNLLNPRRLFLCLPKFFQKPLLFLALPPCLVPPPLLGSVVACAAVSIGSIDHFRPCAPPRNSKTALLEGLFFCLSSLETTQNQPARCGSCHPAAVSQTAAWRPQARLAIPQEENGGISAAGCQHESARASG